jgi:three-Cys-motif partner protein
MPKNKLKFDEIGYWSEVKIKIIEKYATAYSTIMAAQTSAKLDYRYIDAFAGAGQHLRKKSGETIPGSPLTVLAIRPPFQRYYFIDLEEKKVSNLRNIIGPRDDVEIMEGDCNKVLLEKVFPQLRYEDYRRGLCLLDPYGLHLNWEVIAKAAEMETVEMFLNFPVMDMNMNVLWTNPDGVDPEDIRRMNSFWGDETWRNAAYASSPQQNLFGAPDIEKTQNDVIAEAFRKRLQTNAKFKYVSAPLPMRNSSNSIVYYLFFASFNKAGAGIAGEIFNSYRKRKG